MVSIANSMDEFLDRKEINEYRKLSSQIFGLSGPKVIVSDCHRSAIIGPVKERSTDETLKLGLKMNDGNIRCLVCYSFLTEDEVGSRINHEENQCSEGLLELQDIFTECFQDIQEVNTDEDDSNLRKMAIRRITLSRQSKSLCSTCTTAYQLLLSRRRTLVKLQTEVNEMKQKFINAIKLSTTFALRRETKSSSDSPQNKAFITENNESITIPVEEAEVTTNCFQDESVPQQEIAGVSNETAITITPSPPQEDNAPKSTNLNVARHFNEELSPGKPVWEPIKYTEVKCKLCGKTFALHHQLRQHMKSKHDDGNSAGKADRFWCDICSAKFSNHFTLNRHKAVVHEGQRPYSCTFGESTKCGQTFQYKSKLIAHEQSPYSHSLSGDTSFPCSLCDKKFIKKVHLVSHYFSFHKKPQAVQSVDNQKESAGSPSEPIVELNQFQPSEEQDDIFADMEIDIDDIF